MMCDFPSTKYSLLDRYSVQLQSHSALLISAAIFAVVNRNVTVLRQSNGTIVEYIYFCKYSDILVFPQVVRIDKSV